MRNEHPSCKSRCALRFCRSSTACPTQAAVAWNEQRLSSLSTKRKVHPAAMRAKLQVSKDFSPWTSRKRLLGVPAHCHRVREMLDLCFIEHLKINASKPKAERLEQGDLAKGLWCDVSQAVVQRRPWSRVVPTITTSSLLYCFETDCLLTPEWLFKLHGFRPSAMRI